MTDIAEHIRKVTDIVEHVRKGYIVEHASEGDRHS